MRSAANNLERRPKVTKRSMQCQAADSHSKLIQSESELRRSKQPKSKPSRQTDFADSKNRGRGVILCAMRRAEFASPKIFLTRTTANQPNSNSFRAPR